MRLGMRFGETRKMLAAVVVSTLVVVLTWGAFVPAAAAFAPQQNGNGVSWVSASAEAWSGSGQVGPSGATVHLAGAFDSSVDTTNGSGAVAYIGLLDPISGIEEETPTPTPEGGVDTPTPTFTPDGGADTPTPTPTGGEPGETPTPTECHVAVEDSDYNLDGINGIDARDLLLLIEAIDAGVGNPYDLNCDGATNDLDLIQFCRVWKIELPPKSF